MENGECEAVGVERYELPDGWRLKSLGEIVDVLDGKRVPINARERATRTGSIPYYGATGQVGLIDDYMFDEELLLLGEDGAPFLDNGKHKAYIIQGKSWVNNHAHVLRALPETSNSYLCHYLNAFDYRDYVNGTTRLKLTQGAMREIPVPLPPLPEQHRLVKKIESLFAEARTARAALERAEPLLKKFRQAVLSAAFRGELTERDANDEPASVLLERIRAERIKKWQDDLRAKGKDATKAKFVEAETPNTRELGELPEGWEWASLDQCYELGRGRFSFRPRNEPRFFNGQYPFVQIGDLPDDGGEIFSYRQTLNDTGLAISKMFPRGTVLIAIVGATIGNTGILAFDSCVTDSLVAIQADDNVRLKFVEYYLSLKKWEIRESSYASGGQPNISLRTLAPFPIPLPPLAEQQRIVERVESLFSQAQQIERAVEIARRRAEKVEQVILARAFRGGL